MGAVRFGTGKPPDDQYESPIETSDEAMKMWTDEWNRTIRVMRPIAYLV